MAGTGKTVITDDYLKNFAQQKINGFIDAMTTDPSIQKVANFAAGATSGSTGGADPSGTYHVLLAGNPSSGVNSAQTMQTNFKTLTGLIQTQVKAGVTNGRQMQTDLLNVDDVLTNADDNAKITAPEMTADLQNLSFGGSGGPTNTNTPPNTGSST